MKLSKQLRSFSARNMFSSSPRTDPPVSNMDDANLGLCDPIVNPTDADVDIVFVHGLYGDRRDTWTQDDVFWPEYFLSEDLKSTRIFSFGYSAKPVNIFNDVNQKQIEDHATNLITQLEGVRSETKTTKRPIILVAHSLGGLICEHAILSYYDSPEEGRKDVACSVRRIAYFGTPHEGSQHAKWAEMGRKLFQLFNDTNEHLLKNLQEQSEMLIRLVNGFQQFLRSRSNTENQVEVMCFFEEKEIVIGHRRIGLIVPKSSAVLGGHPKTSLDADHRSMCRFKAKTDENYQLVIKVLAGWVEALRQPGTVKPDGTNIVNAHFTAPAFSSILSAQQNAPSHLDNHGTTNYHAGNAYHGWKG